MQELHLLVSKQIFSNCSSYLRFENPLLYNECYLILYVFNTYCVVVNNPLILDIRFCLSGVWDLGDRFSRKHVIKVCCQKYVFKILLNVVKTLITINFIKQMEIRKKIVKIITIEIIATKSDENKYSNNLFNPMLRV